MLISVEYKPKGHSKLGVALCTVYSLLRKDNIQEVGQN